MHAHVDVLEAVESQQRRAGARGEPVIVGVKNLIVHVDLQHGVGQLRHRSCQGVQHGKRIHIGAQAFDMNRDNEHLRGCPGRLNAGTVQHVRVRCDHGSTPPTQSLRDSGA